MSRSRQALDRAIREGRRDYASGNYKGPFGSSAEMRAAVGGTSERKTRKKPLARRTKVTNPFYERLLRKSVQASGGAASGAATEKFHVTWHGHAFSPLCVDEIHGRFDAIDIKELGPCVLDIGAWKIVAYTGTRKEAVAIAEALAAEWRPRRKHKKAHLSPVTSTPYKRLDHPGDLLQIPIAGHRE